MKQYADSPAINRIIDDRKSYFDTSWGDEFYATVWNVDTAQGFGLDIWGRIVVIGRSLEITSGDYFGFNTSPSAQSWNPFNQQPFYSGQNRTSTHILQDQAYRTLILAKALSNISDTNPKSLNRVLRNLFPGRGNAYVLDTGSMSMQYVFDFYLEPWERSVVYAQGILPRPAGVSVTVIEGSAAVEAIYNAATHLYIYANQILPADLSI